MRHRLLVALAATALIGVGGCSRSALRGVGDDEYQDYRTKGGESGKLFGEQGLVLGIGGKSGNDRAADGGALGVNAYLWRAALDTLGFMPLQSADPFGGVIITDWYMPPAGSGERFKATAYILGRQLRADAVKVSVFRQVLQGNQWIDSPVNATTTSEIENKVLARARELRSQTTGS